MTSAVGTVEYSGEHGERIESVTIACGRRVKLGGYVRIPSMGTATEVLGPNARVVGFSQTAQDRLHLVIDGKAGVWSAAAEDVCAWDAPLSVVYAIA